MPIEGLAEDSAAGEAAEGFRVGAAALAAEVSVAGVSQGAAAGAVADGKRGAF